MKPIVAVTWPIGDDSLARLHEVAEVRLHDETRIMLHDELCEFVKGATAVICLLTNKIDAAVLAAAGDDLKIVATMSVGFDHIDRAACKEKNIIVTNAAGVSEQSVAEHTFALLLALAKHVPAADTYVRDGKYSGWDPMLFLGSELSGKTFGLVGVGNIGSRAAKIAAQGFDMNIVYYDVVENKALEESCGARRVEFDGLLGQSDVVSIHVPLMPATHHLIGAEQLARMKPSAYFLNTARGPVVDELALIDALKNKQIAGAGVDVFEFEPEVSEAFRLLPNVVFSPHTASATREARKAMADCAVANVIAALHGATPPNQIKL